MTIPSLTFPWAEKTEVVRFGSPTSCQPPAHPPAANHLQASPQFFPRPSGIVELCVPPVFQIQKSWGYRNSESGLQISQLCFGPLECANECVKVITSDPTMNKHSAATVGILCSSPHVCTHTHAHTRMYTRTHAPFCMLRAAFLCSLGRVCGLAMLQPGPAYFGKSPPPP